MGYSYQFADATPTYKTNFPSEDAPLSEWLTFEISRGWTHYTADAATDAQEALQAAGVASRIAEALMSEGVTLTPAECKIVAEALRGNAAEHLRYLAAFLASACERGGVVIE